MMPKYGLFCPFGELISPPLFRIRRKKRDLIRYVADYTRLYAEMKRAAPAGEPHATAGVPHVSRMCPASARRGGAGGLEPKKLQHSLAEFGAHGSLYTGREKDCQNGGND
jgi:hypothetical protein